MTEAKGAKLLSIFKNRLSVALLAPVVGVHPDAAPPGTAVPVQWPATAFPWAAWPAYRAAFDEDQSRK